MFYNLKTIFLSLFSLTTMYMYYLLYVQLPSTLFFCSSPYRLRNKTCWTYFGKLNFTQTEPFDANVSQQFNVCLATEEKGQNMGSSHRGMKCDYLGSRLVYWLFLQNEDDFERKGISMYQTQ